MSALVQAATIRKFTGSPTPGAINISVTAGNSILVALSALEFSATSPICSVSDGTGYTLGRRTAYSAGAGEKWVAEIHHLHNVSGGAKSIAVTAAGGTFPFGQIQVIEVSGLLNAMPDVAIGTGGFSNSPSTGATGALSQANNFGFAVCGVGAGSNPAGIDAISESFINDYLDNTISEMPISFDHKVIAATTAMNPNWGTLTSSQHWCPALAIYKDAAAGILKQMLENH